MVDIVKLVHRTNKYTYNFKDFWTINTFGRGIYNSKTILKEADEDQSSLVVEIMNFKKKNKTSKSRERRREKKNHILKNLYAPFEGGETVLDAFESKIFPIQIEGTGF